jgi:acyl-CoA thioesterase-1
MLRIARRAAALAISCLVLVAAPDLIAETPVKIVALGDSLTAGFGLSPTDAFPVKLERALRSRGLAVEIVNAGVAGDTSSGGLSRLEWSVPEGTDAVILELGANDALRGLEPRITRAALDSILRRLKERRIEVLLCGMRAPPNLGAEYARAFDAVFPELAKAHGVIFYPFFLDGVAADLKLNLRDGVHPNRDGIEAIVTGILPQAEQLVARVRAGRGN